MRTRCWSLREGAVPGDLEPGVIARAGQRNQPEAAPATVRGRHHGADQGRTLRGRRRVRRRADGRRAGRWRAGRWRAGRRRPGPGGPSEGAASRPRNRGLPDGRRDRGESGTTEWRGNGERVCQVPRVGGVQGPEPGDVPGRLRPAQPGGQRQGEVDRPGSAQATSVPWPSRRAVSGRTKATRLADARLADARLACIGLTCIGLACIGLADSGVAGALVTAGGGQQGLGAQPAQQPQISPGPQLAQCALGSPGFEVLGGGGHVLVSGQRQTRGQVTAAERAGAGVLAPQLHPERACWRPPCAGARRLGL